MNNIGVIKDSSGRPSGLGNSLSTKGKFQQQEDEYLKQNFETRSLKDMSIYLNRTKKSISARLSLLGYKKNYPWIINLTNQKFGKLTVIEFTHNISKHGQAIWKCECDCGNITNVNSGNLRSGKTKSCRCLKSAKGSANSSWTGCGEISGHYWASVTQRAKIKNTQINISIKDAWHLFLQQDKKCALTNLPLKFGSSKLGIETTASLDRIDSSKGYIIDNVQWLHKTVNKMKMDLPQNEFVEFCKLIAQNN